MGLPLLEVADVRVVNLKSPVQVDKITGRTPRRYAVLRRGGSLRVFTVIAAGCPAYGAANVVMLSAMVRLGASEYRGMGAGSVADMACIGQAAAFEDGRVLRLFGNPEVCHVVA